MYLISSLDAFSYPAINLDFPCPSFDPYYRLPFLPSQPKSVSKPHKKRFFWFWSKLRVLRRRFSTLYDVGVVILNFPYHVVGFHIHCRLHSIYVKCRWPARKYFSWNIFLVQKYRSELLLLNNLPITIWILIGQFLQLLMNFHLFNDIFVMEQCCASRNSQDQFDHWKY